MKEDKAKTGADKQADFLISQRESGEPHKHHMAALTVSFVILAIIIGISVIYLSSIAS